MLNIHFQSMARPSELSVQKYANNIRCHLIFVRVVDLPLCNLSIFYQL